MTYSRIAGTGRYLPEKILTNFDLEKMVDTTDEWIRTRTGVERRHCTAPDETTSDMCVAAAKVAQDYAKDNKKFEILGGAMGENALDAAGVEAVSKMPSREELIASIAGCIGAPASNIAGAIGAPASNIASILSTIEDKAA